MPPMVSHDGMWMTPYLSRTSGISVTPNSARAASDIRRGMRHRLTSRCERAGRGRRSEHWGPFYRVNAGRLKGALGRGEQALLERRSTRPPLRAARHGKSVDFRRLTSSCGPGHEESIQIARPEPGACSRARRKARKPGVATSGIGVEDVDVSFTPDDVHALPMGVVEEVIGVSDAGDRDDRLARDRLEHEEACGLPHADEEPFAALVESHRVVVQQAAERDVRDDRSLQSIDDEDLLGRRHVDEDARTGLLEAKRLRVSRQPDVADLLHGLGIDDPKSAVIPAATSRLLGRTLAGIVGWAMRAGVAGVGMACSHDSDLGVHVRSILAFTSARSQCSRPGDLSVHDRAISAPMVGG